MGTSVQVRCLLGSILVASAAGFLGCSTRQDARVAEINLLSGAEVEYAQKLGTNGNPVPLAIAHDGVLPPKLRTRIVDDVHGIARLSVPSGELGQVQEELRDAGVSATLTLDLPVSAAAEDQTAIEADEQLLFAGKQEFELDEWTAKYPAADGRGVRIAIVDDGIALARPGLQTTTTNEAKIIRSINVSPAWQVPVRSDKSCGRQASTAEVSAAWSLEAPSLAALGEPALRMPLDLSPCGINPELTRKARACAPWSDFFPKWIKKGQEDRELLVAALYLEYGSIDAPTSMRLLIDVNADGKIDESEVLSPISSSQPKTRVFNDGSVLAIDVHDTAKILPPAPALDHPIESCSADAQPKRTLNLVVPQTSRFGSHGEGVAAIAAGHRIAGRNFDGVAPGAQLTDVHFADEVGSRRYTIAEVARALKAGGLHADIVNLSYSLFFESAVSQLAMSRMLDKLLTDTKAVYLFSAGNNGPGRGSMNRALLYPTNGIVVGAYLNPMLAQTTFGSAQPFGGVATYSSRGPGFDGGGGALVISPLAGIVPAVPESGFRPFSGTSSATPALAGFTARLVSQLRAEKLEVRPDWLRQAVITSARRLESVAFIDQGFGLPRLLPALEAYRALARKSPLRPTELTIRGETNGQGVVMRGISVRGLSGVQDQYSFTVVPSFSAEVSQQERANYSEHVRLVARAPWISVPPSLLVARSGASLLVALNWHELRSLGAGEHLSEIEVRSADLSELRAVIPVTVLLPEEDAAGVGEGGLSLELSTGGLKRVFLARPDWADGLVVSWAPRRQGAKLCGRSSLYNPSGMKLNAWESAGFGGGRSELAFVTPHSGVHELVFEGRANHTICPADQTMEVSYRWTQLSVSTLSATVSKPAGASGASGASGSGSETTKITGEITLTVQADTQAPGFEGVVELGRPMITRNVLAVATGKDWEWKARERLYLSNVSAIEVRLDPAWMTAKPGSVLQYPRRELGLSAKGSPLFPLSALLSMDSWTRLRIPQVQTAPAPEDWSETEVAIWAFDYGSGADTRVPWLALQLRMELLEEPGSKPSPLAVRPVRWGGVGASRGNPTVGRVSLGQDTERLSGMTLSCAYQSAGFSVRLPCQPVAIP